MSYLIALAAWTLLYALVPFVLFLACLVIAMHRSPTEPSSEAYEDARCVRSGHCGHERSRL